MNTEGGHPWLGVGARGRAVCFIIRELGELYAGTSNYSPSRGSSETCVHMQAGQVSRNRRTTNRAAVTSAESAVARSPLSCLPAPGGTELQRGSLPGGKRPAPGPGPPGGGGASWVRPVQRPGERPVGRRVASFSSTWLPAPTPRHLSPCCRGPRTSLCLSQGCPENRGAA